MQFEKTTTRCGAPLYLFRMPHVGSVAVGVLVFAGTRDEAWPKEAGIAHATEHMVFQGNERLHDSRAVAAEIEVVGGALNAWTSKEMTFYFRVVPSDSLNVATQSLGSTLNTSLFQPEKITPEMQNIVEEIRRTHDSPEKWCLDVFETVVYGKHPLGKSTLGTEDSVTSFTRDDFNTFMARLYCPANYAFIVVGNTTRTKAEKAFNSVFQRDSRSCKKRPAALLEHTNGTREIFERDIKQAHVCLGTTIGSAREPDTKALGFYRAMIDGGMSFPLFQEVRDKRGLCYAIGADVAPWSDYGLFQVYVGTNPARMHEALLCIQDIVKNSYKDRELFAQAKTLLLGRTAISFSSPVGVLQQAAQDIVFLGGPRSPAEIRKEIEAQTPEGVARAVEKHLLNSDEYSYAYVVPKGTKVR